MATGITERETQVVRLMSLGCTAKEAAKILKLAPNDVVDYKTQAMQKLGVNKVALLTRVALQHRITSMTDKLTPAEKSFC